MPTKAAAPPKIRPALSTTEVADIIGVHRKTIENLVARGELRPRLVGNRWRFRPEDIEAYLAGE